MFPILSGKCYCILFLNVPMHNFHIGKRMVHLKEKAKEKLIKSPLKL